MEREELFLDGGAQTAGVVQVGETVRRPLHARSAYVHAVLRHLEAVGFVGAPRLLGIDEQGREILSFISGKTVARAPAHLSDGELRSAARLIREFHDATAGTALAGGRKVVCHGDLGSHNIVFAAGQAVGIIDWDESVVPGSWLEDFAHAVWCCADVCEREVNPVEQARKVRLMCSAYGRVDPSAVIDEIVRRFQRARDQHDTAGRNSGAAIFEEMIAWMLDNGAILRHVNVLA